jgi:hypothetical protein
MGRLRVDGSGEAGDGDFGGYIRYQGGAVEVDSAYAWWKPMDQFKLIIGGFSDGFWGKEGVTGWGFNQMPNDSGVATNYGIWYGNGWGSSFYFGGPYMHNRYTFFEGFEQWGASMEITPADMASINIGIPFISRADEEASDVFQASTAQLNLNLDFGNIAITYDGGSRTVQGVQAGGAIFAYFGGSFGDLGIDFGLSYHLKGDATKGQSEETQPIGVGVGVKYATDSFGVKFRATAALAGEDETTYINTSVLPFFNVSDSIAAFVNVGLGMWMPKEGDSIMGWYFNPYLRVGAEWGPTFYAGIKVWSSGEKDADDKTTINWAIPIALMVSF